jgi:hypothetical protein
VSTLHALRRLAGERKLNVPAFLREAFAAAGSDATRAEQVEAIVAANARTAIAFSLLEVAWGARGRKFKSCRPDHLSFKHLAESYGNKSALRGRFCHTTPILRNPQKSAIARFCPY